MLQSYAVRLEGYIRDIDIEGRFDFWNGWLKKVPHVPWLCLTQRQRHSLFIYKP